MKNKTQKKQQKAILEIYLLCASIQVILPSIKHLYKIKGGGGNMSFNRYIQCVSAICGIYQQRILKLKELNWEGGKERARRREKKKKDQTTQTHLQADCLQVFLE